MAEITHVTDQSFDSEVIDSSKPVLVDFWADWCGPCKMVEPVLKTIAAEEAARIRIVKLNLDENPATASRFGVMSIPTMMLFVDGKEKARVIGARPKAAIWAEIEAYLPAEPEGSGMSEASSEAAAG